MGRKDRGEYWYEDLKEGIPTLHPKFDEEKPAANGYLQELTRLANAGLAPTLPPALIIGVEHFTHLFQRPETGGIMNNGESAIDISSYHEILTQAVQYSKRYEQFRTQGLVKINVGNLKDWLHILDDEPQAQRLLRLIGQQNVSGNAAVYIFNGQLAQHVRVPYERLSPIKNSDLTNNDFDGLIRSAGKIMREQLGTSLEDFRRENRPRITFDSFARIALFQAHIASNQRTRV